MKPYYDDGQAVIYHGDCREIMPLQGVNVDTVAALISDPPYGMNYKPLRGSDGSKLFTEIVHGDDRPFNPTPWLGFKKVVLFGANWYADRLPPSGGWIVWDKTPLGAKNGFYASHAELAWTNCGGTIKKFALQWGGEAHGGEMHLHPTQKPVALMRWLVRDLTVDGELVFDPFMGSGTTLVAAKSLNRRSIGIEIEERYCEIAAKRLSQQTLGLESA